MNVFKCETLRYAFVQSNQKKNSITSKQNVNVFINLPLLQSLLVYPGLHPLSQCPFSLLHEEVLKQ